MGVLAPPSEQTSPPPRLHDSHLDAEEVELDSAWVSFHIYQFMILSPEAPPYVGVSLPGKVLNLLQSACYSSIKSLTDNSNRTSTWGWSSISVWITQPHPVWRASLQRALKWPVQDRRSASLWYHKRASTTAPEQVRNDKTNSRQTWTIWKEMW